MWGAVVYRLAEMHRVFHKIQTQAFVYAVVLEPVAVCVLSYTRHERPGCLPTAAGRHVQKRL